MKPAVELLIHISAPSRGSDDAKYRKQALGFLGFEAATRHTVLSRDGNSPAYGVGDGGVSGIENAGAVRHSSEQLRGEDNEGHGEDTDLSLRGVVASQSPIRSEVQDVPASPFPPVNPPWTSPTISASPPPSAHSRPPQPSSSTAPPSSPLPRIHIPQTPFPVRPATAPTASSNDQSLNPLRRTQNDYWETPPSVVPDSQPSLRAQKHSVPSSETSSYGLSSRIPDHSPPSAKRRRLTSPTKATSSTASESQPPCPPSSPVPLRRTSHTPLHSNPTKLPTDATSSTASASAPHPPPPQRPLSSFPPPQHPPWPPVLGSPPPPQPPSSPALPPSLPASPVLPPFRPTQTYTPAPPPTALIPFTTHLTPSLSIIARELPLSKFFRPVHTTRALRVLERGCWVVSLGKGVGEAVATGVNGPPVGKRGSVWKPAQKGDGRRVEKDGKEERGGKDGRGGSEEGRRREVVTGGTVAMGGEEGPKGGTEPTAPKGAWQPRFAEYITRFIAEGRAGWGVWCERCVAPSPSPSSRSGKGVRWLQEKGKGEGGKGEEEKGEGDDDEAEGGGEVVKIYCWGEVVGHVWLLLFLASERNVRGLGAEWVDAGGEVVVRMA